MINIFGPNYLDIDVGNFCLPKNFTFGKNTKNQIFISFSLCQNDTLKKDCYSDEKISEFKAKTSPYIDLNYKNVLIDHKNFEDPGNHEWNLKS